MRWGHLDSTTECVDKAVAVFVRFELVADALEELSLCPGAKQALDLGPFCGLSLFDEVHECIGLKREAAVVVFLSGGKAGTCRTLFAERAPACIFQVLFDVRLEVALCSMCGWHGYSNPGTLNLPVTASEIMDLRYSRKSSTWRSLLAMRASISVVLASR